MLYKEKAHKRRQELVQIEISLRQAEERLATDPSEPNLEILEDLKIKYDSHFDYIAKGAIIRSRANWYEKGEISNKYFLGLESHRGTKSCIRKLLSSDGNLTTNPLKIMKEIEKSYSDLYTLFTNGHQPGTSAWSNMESRHFGIHLQDQMVASIE